MKKTVLAACAALILVGIAGCGSEEPGAGGRQQGGQQQGDQQQGDQQKPDKQQGDKNKEKDRGGAGRGAAPSDAEKLGNTTELTGDKSGSAFEVAVAAVQDPAKTKQKKPAKGTRYVSARIQVKNTGDTTVPGGSVDKGVELRTDDGQVYRPETKLGAPAGKKSDKTNRGKRSVPLAPGDTADRWVLFGVDSGKKPAQVGLTSASPFTKKDVQWTVG